MPNNIMSNGPSLLLADIVLFRLTLKVLKTRMGKVSTPYKGVLFSSPTDVGSYNPPPFRVQRPH